MHYNFDFLTLTKEARERELETGLVEYIRKFLLELGVGFAFLGGRYPLEVSGKDYRLDLLFYAGKMNFYLSAVDDLLKSQADQPTIALILCKGKDQGTVEYAPRDSAKPLGIAEFRHLEALPEGLKENLPTIEEIEAELAGASE